jgi:hypothetical protein
VDAATESDDHDHDQRCIGRTSDARGRGRLGRGRRRGAGSRVKAQAVRLQPLKIRRPRPVSTGAAGQLQMPLDDPLDRPAKRVKHVSKHGKVVSAATLAGNIE